MAWTASLCLNANMMTEGLVFALTHRGHRDGSSEVAVIVMTLILLLRRAPGQLGYRPASSRRALLVSFPIFANLSRSQLAMHHKARPLALASRSNLVLQPRIHGSPEFTAPQNTNGSPHGPKSPLLFLLP